MGRWQDIHSGSSLLASQTSNLNHTVGRDRLKMLGPPGGPLNSEGKWLKFLA
jgi:hypothetical protein